MSIIRVSILPDLSNSDLTTVEIFDKRVSNTKARSVVHEVPRREAKQVSVHNYNALALLALIIKQSKRYCFNWPYNE